MSRVPAIIEVDEQGFCITATLDVVRLEQRAAAIERHVAELEAAGVPELSDEQIRKVASILRPARSDTDPCEKGTPGCSVTHDTGGETDCETW